MANQFLFGFLHFAFSMTKLLQLGIFSLEQYAFLCRWLHQHSKEKTIS